jgi:capsular polysaccharide biosynthesis protein
MTHDAGPPTHPDDEPTGPADRRLADFRHATLTRARTLLDVEAGLREITSARHHTTVRAATGAHLDIEAGLHAITGRTSRQDTGAPAADPNRQPGRPDDGLHPSRGRSIARAAALSVLVLVAIVAGPVAYSWVQKPTYRSDTQVFVSVASHDPAASGAFIGAAPGVLSGSQFSLRRMQSYRDLLTSPRILEPVIQRLRLPCTTEQLARQVQVDNPPDTDLLEVTVTDTSPDRARSITDAITAQFADAVARGTSGDNGSLQVKATVTESTVYATTRISKNLKKLTLELLVGLGLAVVAAVNARNKRH